MATYTPQKNEDSIAASGDKGVPILGVSNESLATRTAVDNDYGMVALDSKGRVLIAGTITADAGSNLNTSALALESGGNLAAAAASLNVLDDWDNAASDGASVSGDTADDTADAGEPVKIGGVARTTNRTAVGDGDRVNLTADDLGRLVVVQQQVRDLTVHQQTTITSSAAETTVLTAGSTGVFHDVTSIVVTNSSATGVTVTFKDATSGTTRLVLYVPATETRGVVFQVPLTQATAANNWTATCGGAVASIYVTIQAVKNV